MKIAYISTYAPRECGIGAFTKDLFDSMIKNVPAEKETWDSLVVAIDDRPESYSYPDEVKFKIRQEQQEDYIEAARFINLSGADVCVLEHEFGIYGGQSGVYILPLLHKLEIPLIVTLHTVLKTPSYNEKAILTQIGERATKIIVMSNKAIEFLTTVYDIPADKITLIEHGVPDVRFEHHSAKQDLKLASKNVLLTFGFIGRNKGIETVIKALPAVVKQYPNTVYIILGKTHPAVLRGSGEEYRIFLSHLVKKSQLEKNVIFLNMFINQKDLFQYLYASDIYITPYLNEAQITSGTLSYAVGAGSAVISTPYWHAAELLHQGRGRLFDFNDSDGLSDILLELLSNPETRQELRNKAYAYGREMTWPKIGIKYRDLVQQVVQQQLEKIPHPDIFLEPLILPPFELDHIRRMTDDAGIIQHAKFGIPNLKEGYCLDDNARALLMVLMAYKQKKHTKALELLPVYLSYIHYMQRDDGRFRNFLGFNRTFLDEVGSEDSFGRAMWALGYLLGNAPNDAYYQFGKELFFEAAPNFENLQSIRSIANTIIGMCYYLKNNTNDNEMTERLRKMVNILIDEYKKNRTDDWHWFESLLAYDNAMLPLALLHAVHFLNDESVTNVAMESMHFLATLTLKKGYLSVIGNETWYVKDEAPSMFAQQPLDVMATVRMFYQAFRLTKEKAYLDKLYISFMWFLGENDLRMSLYDFETKGCCDGLERGGINRNQGAESTLAYLIAHLTVLEASEEIHYKNH